MHKCYLKSFGPVDYVEKEGSYNLLVSIFLVEQQHGNCRQFAGSLYYKNEIFFSLSQACGHTTQPIRAILVPTESSQHVD